jgi:hypothetical protein
MLSGGLPVSNYSTLPSGTDDAIGIFHARPASAAPSLLGRKIADFPEAAPLAEKW